MISKRHIFTDKLKMVVIDEGDEMLGRGFQEMILEIFNLYQGKHKLLYLVLHFQMNILEITNKFMNEPERILVKKRTTYIRRYSTILY